MKLSRLCAVCIAWPFLAQAQQQAYRDVPFRQARAVLFKHEVNPADFELRTVRGDRDGKILINTDKGLLKAHGDRVVRYREYAALENLNHLDRELLKGKFVFLTDKMLLPLDEAGADYIDVNAGAFVDEELECLRWLVETVQRATDLPLSIDSPDPAVIEGVLPLLERPPMINSITLEPARLAPDVQALLPR